MGVQLVPWGYESSHIHLFYPHTELAEQQMSHSESLMSSSESAGHDAESSSAFYETDLAVLMDEDESLRALFSSPELLPSATGGEEKCGSCGELGDDGVVPDISGSATAADSPGHSGHSGPCPASSSTDIFDMDSNPFQSLGSPHHHPHYHYQQQPHQQHHEQQHQHQQHQYTQQHQYQHHPPNSDRDFTSALSTQDLLVQHLEALRFNKKPLPLQSSSAAGHPSLSRWKDLCPESWSQEDVLNWVYDFAGRYGIDEQIRGENFQNVDGYQLCQMTAQDFVCLSESHAEFFYQDLNHLKSASPTEQGPDPPGNQTPSTFPASRIPLTTAPTPCSSSSSRLSSPEPCVGGGMTFLPLQQGQSSTVGVRKRGRPRKHVSPESVVPKIPKPRGRKPGQRSKGHHLWEFIRDLLLDPAQCPRILRWEDRTNGIFRIVDSKAVSRLWGIQKKNRNMTYEKLSRAIRFCQKESVGYFSKLPESTVYPKKLCFKFGPKTSGWQSV